ncbi:MAG TPA: 2Fe-2S iron-sulfur cluster-binding protein [Thiotrichales bacterium]|nr:2Fe-2S iron-sulfur cluster-binding protein [Thiotrichales bacterium]
MVKIEINGQVIKAREGLMLIDVADDAGINIPRFCYHKKLSVAANCRMCLVDVARLRYASYRWYEGDDQITQSLGSTESGDGVFTH